MLVDYSSSEEEPEDDTDQKNAISPSTKVKNAKKLPSAVELLGSITKSAHEDVPEDHEGRIRSFAHERGNWATFCFIPFPLSEGIKNLQAHIRVLAKENLSLDLTEAKELHVSLTKTVVLRHHWIESFIASLQHRLQHCRKFPLHLNALQIYCNEEKTRTFIGLRTSEEFFEHLKILVQKCDESLKEFNLECFYSDLSFHASILWILGDHREDLRGLESAVQKHFLELLGEKFPDFATRVEKIVCKCGNKMHYFHIS
ncbi:U6 snRNA phosphodiesterase 1 [Phlebotomus argentipes]|uniref:U6 snRNA phosphodiesterase 1 n=1 Tax=Phlebotomus argentipes TaxID=94469 RepID=UPI002892BE94|nr:U6 snRNA phosphodiesterase 1 [Phlebotomus argentipes]